MSDRTEGPALVVRGPHEVGIEDRRVEEPGPGMVLLEPAQVGLCGTDLEILDGSLDPAYVRLPLVLGHEWSARVRAVGPDVRAFSLGDHVVAEGILACGKCAECRRGVTNLCTNYDELGFTTDGALAPGVLVPAHLVHRLDSDVPLLAGALVEPAAVAFRGLRELSPVPGDQVLIIGDGTVALLAALLVRLWSPASVTIAGRRQEQSSLADAAGADRFSTIVPDLASYDVVIEAAGSTTAVETAIASARRGGQILLLGIAGHGNTADVPVDDVVNNDLTIRGSFSYTAAAWAEIVRLINAKVLDPLPLVTHRFALHDYERAIQVLRSGDGGPRGKVVFILDEDVADASS